ncbi:MAG: sodium/glutamate symporter [Neisseria sp.]|nr:sodium/glutamate symporter [Neisseria sp.]
MEWKLDVLGTLLLSIVCLWVGVEWKKRWRVWQRFCIPSPVIGGFLVSVLVYVLKISGVAQISFDTSLQSLLMVAFFTTVGLGGSLQILRTGGRLLLLYLLICWCVALLQNSMGVGLAKMLDVHPVMGVMAGAVSLTGGHGGAAAFGGMAEHLGVPSATVAAIAAATFGLIAGSMLGGPVASYLIRKHQVAIVSEQNGDAIGNTADGTNDGKSAVASIGSLAFLQTLALILAVMLLGQQLSAWFTSQTGFSLPAYVGAMLVAIVVRNVGITLLRFVFISRQSI